jgi:hypothetical protein
VGRQKSEIRMYDPQKNVPQALMWRPYRQDQAEWHRSHRRRKATSAANMSAGIEEIGA